jgi:hypothetical protein
MDVLAAFIEERCIVSPEAWVRFSTLYADYQGWSEEAGEKAETKRRFGSCLKERGFEPDRGSGNAPIRRGIGLRNGQDPGPEGPATVTGASESYSTVTGSNPDKYAASRQESYSSYPKFGKTANDSPREESFLNHGNYGNYGNSGGTHNDFDAIGTREAQSETAITEGEMGGSGAQRDLSPSLAVVESGASLQSNHDACSGEPYAIHGRLTPEQVEDYKRLVAEGRKPEWARAVVRGEEVEPRA